MRRLILVLTVAVVMAALVTASAVPALASEPEITPGVYESSDDEGLTSEPGDLEKDCQAGDARSCGWAAVLAVEEVVEETFGDSE